jgi:hypothetical protein
LRALHNIWARKRLFCSNFSKKSEILFVQPTSLGFEFIIPEKCDRFHCFVSGQIRCGIQGFPLNTAWATEIPTPTTKGWNGSFPPPASTKAVRYLKFNQLNATDGDAYRKELDMLCQIKHCVGTVLAQAENVPEVKASVIEKLHRTQEQQQAQAAHRKDIER